MAFFGSNHREHSHVLSSLGLPFCVKSASVYCWLWNTSKFLDLMCLAYLCTNAARLGLVAVVVCVFSDYEASSPNSFVKLLLTLFHHQNARLKPVLGLFWTV